MKDSEKEDIKKVKKKIQKKNDFEFNASNIPENPGCYLFYDKNKKLLYIGKAKNLKKRVSNYFQKNKKNIKTKLLVSKIRSIETQVVNSEMEALILENNLIKEHRPPFNILLRDDKNFLYLRVTNEDEPKLEIVRKVIKDGSKYFGPKTSAKYFRNTIRFCQKFFGAKMVKSGQDYYINQLMGKNISSEEYRQNIEDMKKFLSGNTQSVIKKLQEKMMNFASMQNFEAAGKVRDTIISIEGSTEKQTVEFMDLIDRDFIHFYKEEKNIFMMCLSFRQGKLKNQIPLKFSVSEFHEDSEILSKCLTDLYSKMTDFPREIYLPENLENHKDLEIFLSKKYFDKKRVEIFVPQKGDKKKILDLTFKNAKNYAKKSQIEEMSHQENFVKALPKLAESLDLKEPPKRMECYDISHFNGTHTVASMVVFIDGKPLKSEYKKFNIKSLEKNKIDDFASMNEVLSRRFARILMAAEKEKIKLNLEEKKNTEKLKEEEPELLKKDFKKTSWENYPDLIVIDGGKGQLSSVMKIFKDMKFDKKKFNPQTQIISLAKREEEIFRPKIKESIKLDFNNPALKLLQRIRDEAHRFAITANRASRSKQSQKSILDEIPGIGPSSKKKLMQKFEMISNIRNASDEELLKIISKSQLKNLRRQI